ncbi:unnamed protein product [Ostreobium quekettii]|uniref:Uncharacterized protein n=1 Tax=Ostreobium quekettii TaxID=121088 RepID=A0A8S1IXY8_9CHLO|nr:unnamed protein product [Ostreobium quekettii]|eukprot:evm.model.scf_887.5 EVM.evm.TU.scf_887.5   scf_887:28685-29047(-)
MPHGKRGKPAAMGWCSLCGVCCGLVVMLNLMYPASQLRAIKYPFVHSVEGEEGQHNKVFSLDTHVPCVFPLGCLAVTPTTRKLHGARPSGTWKESLQRTAVAQQDILRETSVGCKIGMGL